MAPQRSLAGKRDLPLCAAPGVDLDRPLVHEPVLAVPDGDEDARTRRQERHAPRRVVAQDRLERDLLAQPVHAAIAEDGAAEHRLRLGQVEVVSEIPRQNAFVPVAAHISDVVVLLRRDDEGELPPPFGIAQRRLGGEGNAVSAGGPRPEHHVVGRDDGDARARHGIPGIQPRDEHQGVLRTVLHRDAQVGDLHDGGADSRPTARPEIRPGARDGITLPHRRPDQTGAAADRGGDVEAVRLDTVGGCREPSRGALCRWRYAERRPFFPL